MKTALHYQGHVLAHKLRSSGAGSWASNALRQALPYIVVKVAPAALVNAPENSLELFATVPTEIPDWLSLGHVGSCDHP